MLLLLLLLLTVTEPTPAAATANRTEPTPAGPGEGDSPLLPLSAVVWLDAGAEGTGAGCVVDRDKRWVVTCRHVVGDRKTLQVFFPWFEAGRLVTDRATYLRQRDRLRRRGGLVTGRVVRTCDRLDLALVEVEALPPGTQAVRLAAAPPATGEPLWAVGHRLNLPTVWTVTTGSVRAVGRLTEGYFWRGQKLAVDAAAVIGQLPTEEGDSGGPVFNAAGEVVGIVTALRRQCPLAAVCVAVSAVRQFLGPVEPVEAPRAEPHRRPHPPTAAEALRRATVWVRPTATDVQLAGVLIEPDRVLTVAHDLVPGERVGVAFPIREGDRWQAERSAYRDPLVLRLSGHWCGATVLARDPVRNLALLRLDAPSPHGGPLPVASHPPRPGAPLHTMNHPGGLEFAWVYAGGSVRQTGRINLGPDRRAGRGTLGGREPGPVAVIVCQLPAQAGSPGGAVTNDRGELVGIVTSREAGPFVAYAVAAGEIVAFLDAVRTDRPPRSLRGLLARLGSWPEVLTRALARGLGERAEAHLSGGRAAEAEADATAAVRLDPGCPPARIVRARLAMTCGRPAEAAAELDAAVERGPDDRRVRLLRAELSVAAKDWRKARADLERILAVEPADAEARQRLVGVFLELGETARAAAAVRDTLRADPKRSRSVAADLLAQSDRLRERYPQAPSVAVGWLLRVAADCPAFAHLEAVAAGASGDDERLARLRAELHRLSGR